MRSFLRGGRSLEREKWAFQSSLVGLGVTMGAKKVHLVLGEYSLLGIGFIS